MDLGGAAQGGDISQTAVKLLAKGRPSIQASCRRFLFLDDAPCDGRVTGGGDFHGHDHTGDEAWGLSFKDRVPKNPRTQ